MILETLFCAVLPFLGMCDKTPKEETICFHKSNISKIVRFNPNAATTKYIITDKGFNIDAINLETYMEFRITENGSAWWNCETQKKGSKDEQKIEKRT